MSPAKLLGLAQTADSIIVPAGAASSVRALPRAVAYALPDKSEDRDSTRSDNVLRTLIALRRRGEK